MAASFSAGRIAKILGISRGTVNKCIGEGYLPSHKTILDGRCARRVTKADLIVFMQNYGFWDSMPAVSRYLMGIEPDMLCVQKELGGHETVA